MNDEKRCGQCGAVLPAESPQGLCPACLLQRGLATEPSARTDYIPPTPAELARFFPELEILELIGRGGMGAVYKARQKRLDRFVALKILPASVSRAPAFAERFAREAQALARLTHSHIVAVHDSGQADGLFYFLMEFVDGMNLRQLLDAGKVAPKEALAIVPQICDALQYAHDKGIVHRDIKPENILLAKDGTVKIADFGLVKLVGLEAKDQTITGSHEVMGTPHYMAPEQVEHPQHVDHRADIYSLGVVFYEMLTGELPIGRFAPPSRKVQIDVRLDEVVLRALEKEPERRYQQASEVKTQVETIVTTPPEGRASSRPQPSSEAADEAHWLEWERRAPGWRIRCRKCGFTEHWGKYGIRLLAAGTKWTVGRCAQCGRFRIHVIEKGPVPRNVATTDGTRGTRALPEARLSPTALFGACLGISFLLTPVGLALMSGFRWERMAPGWFILLLGSFTTTLVGWVAVSQIRRSAGRLYGLGLAVFDGLLFPLLALDGLIAVLFRFLGAGIVLGFGPPHNALLSTLHVLMVICIVVVDWLIIRGVWRAANSLRPTSSSRS